MRRGKSGNERSLSSNIKLEVKFIANSLTFNWPANSLPPLGILFKFFQNFLFLTLAWTNWLTVHSCSLYFLEFYCIDCRQSVILQESHYAMHCGRVAANAYFGLWMQHILAWAKRLAIWFLLEIFLWDKIINAWKDQFRDWGGNLGSSILEESWEGRFCSVGPESVSFVIHWKIVLWNGTLADAFSLV